MKPVSESVPITHLVGTTVRYYDAGWHMGTLDEIKKGLALIIPTAAYKAGKKKRISIPVDDVKPLEV